MGEIVDLTDEWTVLIVEASLARPILGISMAQVPFANDRGVVARVLQSLRQQPFVGWEPICVRCSNDKSLLPIPEWISSGHQRSARRCAYLL